MSMTRRCLRLGSIAVFVVALAGAAGTAAAHGKKPGRHEVDILPVIFVHGFAGSAAQYQSQAMRFSSNGVPDAKILAFEYDTGGGFGGAAAAVTALDAFVDETRARFGVERVNLVGHSLGTFVSNTYLANPERAAKIAKYIGIDGASNPTCGSTAPGTLQCMGIFRGSAGNVGGNNVYFNDTQTHVEVATSPESFAAQFEFFTGEPPKTTDIVADRGIIKVAGRVVIFPANVGAEGAKLEMWRVSGKSGKRKYRVAKVTIGADGSFGPLLALSGKHYEFQVERAGFPVGHYYFQPWPRSTYMVRMNASAADSPTLANTNASDHHAAMIVQRQKEWWTTHPSGENDSLTIATRSRRGGFHPPVEVLTPITSNGTIAIHVHDDAATPLVSSLSLLPFFPTQPFQSGVDVFMPAATPPDGTIRIVNAHRGRSGSRELQVLNVRNWASSTDRIVVQFNDYLQD